MRDSEVRRPTEFSDDGLQEEVSDLLTSLGRLLFVDLLQQAKCSSLVNEVLYLRRNNSVGHGPRGKV